MCVQDCPWVMEGSRENDLNETSCISLGYLLSSSPRRQIYIISSVIKLSTPPSRSSLSAGDFTDYFNEKIEAFRGEWPHLPITKLTNLYIYLYVNFLLLQWCALSSCKASGPILSPATVISSLLNHYFIILSEIIPTAFKLIPSVLNKPNPPLIPHPVLAHFFAFL